MPLQAKTGFTMNQYNEALEYLMERIEYYKNIQIAAAEEKLVLLGSVRGRRRFDIHEWEAALLKELKAQFNCSDDIAIAALVDLLGKYHSVFTYD